MKKNHFIAIAIMIFTTFILIKYNSDPFQKHLSAKHEVNPQLGEICKATAAITFGREYKIMEIDQIDSDGIAYVHYYRPLDNSRWAIKCKLNGYQVIWASNNPNNTGRWRNDPLDGELHYSISSNKLTMLQKFSDGSVDSKTYDMEQEATN
ncbi:hypothetical protein [Pantoea dispersa]|uniref:hypothetical protein n=1 Tax=Pantoea dispersa TaxID=59814 RepID=UPI001F516C00|nr:hypothetical protein [Pantoea dispersa]